MSSTLPDLTQRRLGKTVTMLALVLSTAGLKPQQPLLFWDDLLINENWNRIRSADAEARNLILLPIMKILNEVERRMGFAVNRNADFANLRRSLFSNKDNRAVPPTVADLERSGDSADFIAKYHSWCFSAKINSTAENSLH